MPDRKLSEQTVSVYEDVRRLLDQLRAIDAKLGAPALQGQPAFLRAKKHMTSALRELSALAELLEGMHTRPSENTHGTTRDNP